MVSFVQTRIRGFTLKLKDLLSVSEQKKPKAINTEDTMNTIQPGVVAGEPGYGCTAGRHGSKAGTIFEDVGFRESTRRVTNILISDQL